MTNTPQAPQPGWYPDEHATGGERWWDGQKWTDQQRPAAEYSNPNVGRDPNQPLLMSSDAATWGIFWAVLLPLVGFVYGLVLLRTRPRQGKRIMLIAVAATLVYGVLLALFS